VLSSGFNRSLPNFKLREGLSIINNFKTGDITTVSAMTRIIKMSKNMGIFSPNKRCSIINKYCKDLNVKVVFSPFKLSSMFSPKDFISHSLKSRVVYQFTCASCGARYIGEINRHFHTRVNEHFFRPKIYPKTVANTYLASLGLFSWTECPFGSRVIKCDFVDM